MAVGKRPSPSAAPLEDWPCGVIGSGFTTQRRLRSPTAGVVSSRPLLPVKAGETPLPRHLGRIAAIKLEPPASESPKGQSLRMRCCELEWQPCNARRRDCVRGPTAPSHTPLPTRMPKHASHGSEYPTAPTRGCLTCPMSSQPHVARRHGPFPWGRAPVSPPKREERTPAPPRGVGEFSTQVALNATQTIVNASRSRGSCVQCVSFSTSRSQ